MSDSTEMDTSMEGDEKKSAYELDRDKHVAVTKKVVMPMELKIQKL